MNEKRRKDDGGAIIEKYFLSELARQIHIGSVRIFYTDFRAFCMSPLMDRKLSFFGI
jgi:hypothetical protein